MTHGQIKPLGTFLGSCSERFSHFYKGPLESARDVAMTATQFHKPGTERKVHSPREDRSSSATALSSICA